MTRKLHLFLFLFIPLTSENWIYCHMQYFISQFHSKTPHTDIKTNHIILNSEHITSTFASYRVGTLKYPRYFLIVEIYLTMLWLSAIHKSTHWCGCNMSKVLQWFLKAPFQHMLQLAVKVYSMFTNCGVDENNQKALLKPCSFIASSPLDLAICLCWGLWRLEPKKIPGLWPNGQKTSYTKTLNTK